VQHTYNKVPNCVLHKKHKRVAKLKKNHSKSILFENILGIFAWFVFFLALFLAVFTVFASLSGEKNGKEIFGHKLLIVASDSMSKSHISEHEKIFFNAGDLIVIKTMDSSTVLSVGDVITFYSHNPESYGKTVTHKIREVKYSQTGEVIGYVTYGINTGVNDVVVVTPENVIGKYVFKVPNVGHVFSFLKSPRGYYLSILTPAVLLIIFFSIKIGKTIGKKEIATSYNEEFENLKIRLIDLENIVNSSKDEIVKSDLLNDRQDETIIEEQALTDINIAKPLNITRAKKISFSEKILSADKDTQKYFDLLHQSLTSYKGVNSRLSYRCTSYRLGRKLIAKITLRGKTLKLHLALKLEDFNKNVYFQKDLSLVKAYQEVPFTIKVKSQRGLNNAIKLIEELMTKNAVVKKVISI